MQDMKESAAEPADTRFADKVKAAKKAAKKKAPAKKKAAKKKAPAKKGAAAKKAPARKVAPPTMPAKPSENSTDPYAMPEKMARENLARVYGIQSAVDRCKKHAEKTKESHDEAKADLKAAEAELYAELKNQKDGAGPLFE